MHKLNITLYYRIREQISKITIVFSMQAYHERHACKPRINRYVTRMQHTVCDIFYLFMKYM